MDKASLSSWIAAIPQSYVTGLIVYDPRHNERVSRSGSKEGFKPRRCFERVNRPGFSHRCVVPCRFQDGSAAVL